MIHNKEDLKYYLEEDAKQIVGSKPNIKDWIIQNERWYIHRYKRELRYVEYYMKCQWGG